MIGHRFLNRSIRQQSKYGSMVNLSARGFAGGGAKKENISADERDFDVVMIGGLNVAALTKFLQKHDDAQNLKIAIVTDKEKYVHSTSYFGACHTQIDSKKVESAGLSGMIDGWSRIEGSQTVSKVDPHANTVSLSNGKVFNYKALVLAPGLEHKSEFIEGLPEMEATPEVDNVFVHAIDTKERVSRNFWNGYRQQAGDFITYSPQFPYKGEGCDFYAPYYESIHRLDSVQEANSRSARVQYFTPNKEIYTFPYANEVALDECSKRNIDVYFGWEMVKMHQDEHEQKIATFRNVETGETIQKPFFGACINPTSKPYQWLRDSGLTDADGMVDVNKYTLQHSRFENVFAFGDCIAGETTRTQIGAMRQNPVVKNNLLQFLHGKEVNGVYDGYTELPFLLGTRCATKFAHLHDYEPASRNHMVPHYGMFSYFYFGRLLSGQSGAGVKYGSFQKTHGPPYYQFPQTFDPLEKNEYLNSRQIPHESAMHPAALARLSSGDASVTA